jgi:hypothetical protein
MGSIPIPAANAYTPFGKGQTTNTMNTEAIERIKGYCCEVTQEQWDELVRVADEVGVRVGKASRASGVTESDKFARYNGYAGVLGVYYGKRSEHKTIPFPDFLAKLIGEKKWQPKAGEMVEVGGGYVREYIATRGGKHYCWGETGDGVASWDEMRPLRPTITRTEAERLLNKRIID